MDEAEESQELAKLVAPVINTAKAAIAMIRFANVNHATAPRATVWSVALHQRNRVIAIRRPAHRFAQAAAVDRCWPSRGGHSCLNGDV